MILARKPAKEVKLGSTAVYHPGETIYHGVRKKTILEIVGGARKRNREKTRAGDLCIFADLVREEMEDEMKPRPSIKKGVTLKHRVSSRNEGFKLPRVQ